MSSRVWKISLVVVAVVAAFLVWRHWPHGAEESGAAADDREQSESATRGASRLDAARKYQRGARVPSCEVEGVVVSADGPVAGARVQLLPQRADLLGAAHAGDTPQAITAATDEAGRFSIRVADGPYAMAVSHPDHLALTREIGLACGADALRFELANGGVVLEGQVRDILGGPVAGAVVSVAEPRFSLTQETVRSTVSDAEGLYRIRVQPGSYVLAGQHPDYVRAWEMVNVAGELTRRDLVLSPGAAIEGVVVHADTGEPVPGARVMAASERGFGGMAMPGMGPASITDGGGRFRLRGLSSGTVKLSASGQGVASRQPTVVQLSIAEQLSDITVFVEGAVDVSGRVVDRDQPERGIAGAYVSLVDLTAGTVAYNEVPTGGDGSFRIHGVAPGKYMASAMTDEAVPRWMGPRVTVASEEVSDLLIELDRGHTIRGRVKPSPAVSVRVEVDFEKVGMAGAMTAGASMMARADIDDDGSFSIGPVAEGSYFVVATGMDGRVGRTEVEVEGDVDGVVVDLSSAIEVKGRVTDDGGAPVSGVTVIASREGGVPMMRGMMGRGPKTDAQGRFTAYVTEPGEHRFQVRDGRGPLPHASVDGRERFKGPSIDIPAEGLRDLSLQIEPADGRITGRVVDSAGAPVADAFVEADMEAEEGAYAYVRPSHPVVTGTDGRFEITGLRRAEHTVRASTASGAARARRKDVKTGTQIELSLEPLSSIRGTVTASGVPVKTYTVRIQRAENTAGGFRSWMGSGKRIDDEAGAFHFERVEPGAYMVSVRSEVGQGVAQVEVRSGADSEVQVVVESFATVRGRLVDPDGNPIADAMVMAVQMVDGKPVRPDMEANVDMMNGGGPRTGDDGSFVLTEVPAGKSMVWLSGEKGMVFKTQYHATREVDAGPGADIDLGEIEAKKAGEGDDEEAPEPSEPAGEPPAGHADQRGD